MVPKGKSWAVDEEHAAARRKKPAGWSLIPIGSMDLVQVAIVAVVNSWLSETLPLLHGKPQPMLMSVLFSKEIADPTKWDTWSLPNWPWLASKEVMPIWTMFFCFLMKWFMTVASLSLPTPTGVVAPTMIIGALLGRVVGFLLPAALIDFVLTPVDPSASVTDEMRHEYLARLAIVGAAAFCSSVTRAFAMAITIFEVLALPNSVISLSSASLTAIFVANQIVPGFFDQILLNKGYAGVPALTSIKLGMMPISKVMRPLDTHSECLSNPASLTDIHRLLALPEKQYPFFPIVHHLRGGVDALLMGVISRENLDMIQSQRSAQQEWERDLAIDFLDPMQWQQNQQELITRMPLHVGHHTMVKDVYLLMKVRWDVEYILITKHGRLLGVITGTELLGKT